MDAYILISIAVLAVAGALWWGFVAKPDPLPNFEEREPHEVGFAAYYEQEIAPILASLERERRGAIAIACLAGVVCAALALAFYTRYDPKSHGEFAGGWAYIKLRLLVAVLLVAPLMPLFWFLRRKQTKLLDAICRYFPRLYWTGPHQAKPTNLLAFRRLGLLPPVPEPRPLNLDEQVELVDYEEIVYGHCGDVEVWLGEGDWIVRQGRADTRVFSGTLIELKLPERPGVYYRVEGSPTTPPPPSYYYGEEDTRPGLLEVRLDTDEMRDAFERLGRAFAARTLKCSTDGKHVYTAMRHRGKARPLSLGYPWDSIRQIAPAIRSAFAQITLLREVAFAVAGASEESKQGSSINRFSAARGHLSGE